MLDISSLFLFVLCFKTFHPLYFSFFHSLLKLLEKIRVFFLKILSIHVNTCTIKSGKGMLSNKFLFQNGTVSLVSLATLGFSFWLIVSLKLTSLWGKFFRISYLSLLKL